LDSEDEEPVPNISSYMTHANNHAHTHEGSNVAAGGDPVVVDTLDTSPEDEEVGANQLENMDWQALINAQT